MSTINVVVGIKAMTTAAIEAAVGEDRAGGGETLAVVANVSQEA